MDPCVLADTGINQVYLLLLAGGFTCVAMLLLKSSYSSRVKNIFFILSILFIAAITILPAGSLLAQSAEDCPPGDSASQSEDGQGGNDGNPQTLGLVDDQVVIQFPSDENWMTTTTYGYHAILGNDTAPSDDPLDWDTVDLDPSTAGRQLSRSFQHPDAPVDENCEIANVSVGTFGVLNITMNYSCDYPVDVDSGIYETLVIPNDYQIPPFTYTANTQSGQPAPVPAVVKILAEPNPSAGVVVANNDEWACTHGSSPWFGSLPGNDTTTIGTINPSTVDLNPSLPGLQQSVVAKSNMGSTYQLSVDSSGEFTIDVINMVDGDTATSFTAYYTIQNSAGTVSNVATIKEGNCPT